MNKTCFCTLPMYNPDACKYCTENGNLNTSYGFDGNVYIKDKDIRELQSEIESSYKRYYGDKKTMEYKNLINEIKKRINYEDNRDNTISITYYNDDEFSVELFESKIVITLEPKLNKIYVNFDILEGEIDTETLECVVKVMQFLKENTNTFKLQ